MPTTIERDELRRLVDTGAQLVEVLPAEEFREAHLPGALNIPLDQLTPQAAQRLDRDRPVITYCYDTQCDMSPRAAWRLESLGFGPVYHYAPGKADWMGAGLHIEGEAAGVPMIGALSRTDVPTCALDEPAGEVFGRLEASGWDTCFVVNGQGVVLGRIYLSRLSADDLRPVHEVMDPGPSTYRPDLTASEMAQRMHEYELATAPVTSSDGRLIGLLMRRDVEKAAEQAPTQASNIERERA